MLTPRSKLSDCADRHWDLVIIGGGVTGAGLFREACARGLRTLLLEQGDFASGTSSRSSKLVHGGLRYLAKGQLKLTLESVREREALLAAAPGLVEPQPFVFAVRKDQKPGLQATRIGLLAYDTLARRRRARRLSWDELPQYAPGISTRELDGALYFEDARTDDARLVLRLLQEGCARGGVVSNYCQVNGLLQQGERVNGVAWNSMLDAQSGEARAATVIDAAGVWAAEHGGPQTPVLRPLRGSHLIFPAERLPLPAAVSFLHPQDGRPVFAYAWEGISLLGTTDVDHADSLDREPRITPAELDYLLQAAGAMWPGQQLGRQDVRASFAGVRAVLDSGADNPSDESRESAMWQTPGLIGITGGKLTNFRRVAQRVLDALDHKQPATAVGPVLDGVEGGAPEGLSPALWTRLRGRYGRAASELLRQAPPEEWRPIAGTVYLWAELRWAANHESVQHLDDLLLRRTRLGLVLPAACRAQMREIRALVQPLLGWNDRRWGNEEGAWYRRWSECYHLPAVVPA